MENLYLIRLRDIVRSQIKGKYSDLVTRQVGKIILSRLEEKMNEIPEGGVVVFDFSDIGAIDYSCADEIFARLIQRLKQNEYGEKFVVFKDLSPHHKENIHIVLEKKDLAVLVKEKSGWGILGALDNYLFQTLKTIMQKGCISSSSLSDRLDLALNTASMRLSNLSKLRLVKKRGAINKVGKRYFIYESILTERN